MESCYFFLPSSVSFPILLLHLPLAYHLNRLCLWLCKSSSSLPVTDKENEEGQNLNLTASEMLLQLEREERRLADAEKLQESLKRKAVNLELQRNSPNKAMTSRQ